MTGFERCADLYHRGQSLPRILVENLESVVGQHPVLVHHAYQIGCDAHDQQVQQRLQIFEIDAVLRAVRLGQFEPDPAARQIVERVLAVFPLRVEHGYRVR